jgi:RHS repeat-associated protein
MKKFLFCLLFLYPIVSNAQISGLTQVEPNQVEEYYVTFPNGLHPYSIVVWNVIGGTATPYGQSGVVIHWDNSPGVGYIEVYEDLGSQTVYLEVQIGSFVPTISPPNQLIPFGSSASPLEVLINYNNLNYSLQWQEWSFSNQVWTNLTGEVSETFLPPSQLFEKRKYRCLLYANGLSYDYLEATIDILSLDPGILSYNPGISFNSSILVDWSPASGGFCYSTSYTYTWEQSIENGAWTVIGTSEASPTVGPVIGNMKIRRRVSCGSQEMYSNILELTPQYTSGDFENLNYVREIVINKPEILSWQQADLLQTGDKIQTTHYLDGFGREIQMVTKQVINNSGNWEDQVKHFEIDLTGNTEKDFITYPSAINSGKYKTNAALEQRNFVQAYYNQPSTAPTYSSVELNNSGNPFTRKFYLAGQAWGGNLVGTEEQIDFNLVTDNVHVWTLSTTPGSLPGTATSLYYQTGMLTKKVTIDEDNNKVISFTDLNGNIILTKVQVDNSASETSHIGWACTYYVYDDFGNLRFSIPPKAVGALEQNLWNFTQGIADELCFSYEFDARGRLIVQKQPGIGSKHSVYDKKNRLVMSKDQNLNLQSKWNFFIYDGLQRNIATGVLSSPASRATMQGYANAVQDGDVQISAFVGTNNSETIIADAPVIFCNGCSDIVYNSVSEYDKYSFSSAISFNSNYTFSPSNAPNILVSAKSNLTRGLQTSSFIRILDHDNNSTNDKFIYSTFYYDEKGRSFQVLTNNSIKNNLSDYTTMQYDFSGKIMSTFEKHTLGSTNNTAISESLYDQAGSPVKFSMNYNNSQFKELASYSYDLMGQLKKKVLAPGYMGNEGIEILDYTYNIQGWLTGINRAYALSNNPYNQWDRFFGMDLGYENSGSLYLNPKYNGTITGLIWKTQGDNAPKKYDFVYDKLGRLTAGNYKQRNDPSQSWNTDYNYSTSISYNDLNGNIGQLIHFGMVPGQSNAVEIDNLQYTYNNVGSGVTGNKLVKVADNSGFAFNGFLGDFKNSVNQSEEYFYDNNGNLVKDLNKKIHDGSNNGITYNFLDKAEKVVIEGKSTTYNIYDASGTKLSSTVETTNGTQTTYYLGNYVYEEDDLKYVLHQEGRLKIILPVHDDDRDLDAGPSGVAFSNATKGVFEYFILDHLQNVRMILTEEEQVEKYLATMEDNTKDFEAPLFGAVESDGTFTQLNNEWLRTRVKKQDYVSQWNQSAGNSEYISRLTASTQDLKIGPNMFLKVMAGDKIEATVNYYFKSNASYGNTNPADDIASSLINALFGYKGSVISHHNRADIGLQLQNNSELSQFLNNHYIDQPNNPDAPKAYLNFVFLDEQFNFIPGDLNNNNYGSGARRVELASQDAWLELEKIAPKNGWVYIYLSNESDEPVYFDNLYIQHGHSLISEEKHYYPFGLKIAGLSSRAFDKLESRYGYQGSYSEEDAETGWNDFDLRSYDPQIGRWTSADPYDQFPSLFVGMGNNPVSLNDPTGGWGVGATGGSIGGILGAIGGYMVMNNIANKNHWNNVETSSASALGILVGGFLGSALGYGLDASLAKGYPMGTGGWLMHTRAFIKSFFRGDYSSDITKNKPLDYRNARLPNLDINITISNPFTWQDYEKIITRTNVLLQPYLSDLNNDGRDPLPNYNHTFNFPNVTGEIEVVMRPQRDFDYYHRPEFIINQGSVNITIKADQKWIGDQIKIWGTEKLKEIRQGRRAYHRNFSYLITEKIKEVKFRQRLKIFPLIKRNK